MAANNARYCYPKMEMVRCLGPNPNEHYFKTGNPKTNRICKKCREKQQKASRMEISIVRDER